MIINKIFVLGILTTVIIGCSKKNNGSSNKIIPSTLGGTPIYATKADNDCKEKQSDNASFLIFLPQFIDGVSTKRMISFFGQLKSKYNNDGNSDNNNMLFIESVGKGAVAGTSYGRKYIAQGTLTYEQSSLDNKYSYMTSPGFISEDTVKEKELTICTNSRSYDEFTFESTGLNVSHSITKTFNLATSILGKGVLNPIKIKAIPIIYYNYNFSGGPEDGKLVKGFETDNAYYDPSKAEITFLPQSIEYQRKVETKTPFWQIPMVASHEYGHHIFNTLITNKIKSNMSFTKRCFQHNTELNPIIRATDTKRDNTSDFALGAINEGFADLISFYSLDEDEAKVTGIACFETNRDIMTSHFGNNTSKQFSQKALDKISAKYYSGSRNSCDKPDFQEIHDVGAMFAHGINNLISKVTTDKKIKLKILLNWAKNLAIEHKNIFTLDAANYIFAAMELAYKTALEEQPRGSRSVDGCSVMNDSFPDLTDLRCRYLK
jgi:hypothetical protein